MMEVAMSRSPLLNKRQVLERLLDAGMVLVALDARHADVEVPSQYRGDMQLRLNLSYRFELPMKLTDSGIEASLTFDGLPFSCNLPWDAIFLMVSHTTGQPVLFREDVPQEIASAHLPGLPDPDAPDLSPRRPKLRLIAEEAPAEPEPEPSTDVSDAAPLPAPQTPPPSPPPTSGKRRGHLRVVK